MAMKTLAKVLDRVERGFDLVRSGVSSLGQGGTGSVYEDEPASSSNPMFSSLLCLLCLRIEITYQKN